MQNQTGLVSEDKVSAAILVADSRSNTKPVFCWRFPLQSWLGVFEIDRDFTRNLSESVLLRLVVVMALVVHHADDLLMVVDEPVCGIEFIVQYIDRIDSFIVECALLGFRGDKSESLVFSDLRRHAICSRLGDLNRRMRGLLHRNGN